MIPSTPLPTAAPRAGWTRVAAALVWLVIAWPALHQLALLGEAIAGRLAYPYDLEWMEGGMLHHALRIQSGAGIYGPPSVDFIPYLYTPLYPALIAVLGRSIGISYLLGRLISVAALVGIASVAIASLCRRSGAAWVGIALALGLFAACYPFVEGWYDVVRADTLFLCMITGGLAGLPAWARSEGAAGHAKVAAGAALLALAFFCKQTGILYVGLGGLIVLVVNWRRVPIYVVTAGVLGLGGVWVMNHATGGWFWIYVSEIHRAHDFSWPRFLQSFGNILWHFPALTISVGVALIVALVTRVATGSLPAAARPLLLWTSAFALSTVVGAIGWGTEFAHFNAYMPALLHGALAAGAAVGAIQACGAVIRPAVGTVAAMVVAAALAVTCWTARWQPARYIPRDADVVAGDRLIARLQSIAGDVWMPSHPWYLVLAGKAPHVHRMGIKDVTTRQSRTVAGLDARLRGHAFAAVVVDNRDVHLDLDLARDYHPALVLPAGERPHVYTGASVVPEAIWLPTLSATPPATATKVFDFETAQWTGWEVTGTAWGAGPTAEPLPGQGLVLGATGTRYATSMHGGDAATGRALSPPFALAGGRLTVRLGGDTNVSKLGVELIVDDEIVRTAIVPPPAGDDLRTVTLELGELRGKQARLALVDEASDAHLDVDDVWLWP